MFSSEENQSYPEFRRELVNCLVELEIPVREAALVEAAENLSQSIYNQGPADEGMIGEGKEDLLKQFVLECVEQHVRALAGKSLIPAVGLDPEAQERVDKFETRLKERAERVREQGTYISTGDLEGEPEE